MVQRPEDAAPVIAVEEGGWHAAEALIVARYQMFTQVYFHHTRRAYDHHLTEALRAILQAEQAASRLERKDAFPPPVSREHLKSYLVWDDWRVLGLLSEGMAGEHGRILQTRNHYRSVWQTPEVPSPEDDAQFSEVQRELGPLVRFIDDARSSWYTFRDKEIPIVKETDRKVVTLSSLSSVVRGLRSVEQRRIYVSPGDRKEAEEIIQRRLQQKGRTQNG